MNFRKKLYKHLLFLFLLGTISYSSFAQNRTAKTLFIITKLQIVEAQQNQYTSILEYLKTTADGDDSIKIAAIENKLTAQEITKRFTAALDTICTEEEINIIYAFMSTTVFDKLMNYEYNQAVLYKPFEDIDKEIEEIRNKLPAKISAHEYTFTPIPVDRSDGFYETINYNPYEDQKKIQLSEYPAITIEDIEKVEKKKKSDYKNYPEIRITLTENGKQKFLLATQNNIEKPIAIVIDKHIVSMPIVKEPIPGGELTLNGDFSDAEIDVMIERLGGKK